MDPQKLVQAKALLQAAAQGEGYHFKASAQVGYSLGLVPSPATMSLEAAAGDAPPLDATAALLPGMPGAPGVQFEEPPNDGMLRRRFRLMSAGLFRPRLGWFAITVDMPADVLKAAVPLFGPHTDERGIVRPLTIYKDHEVETDNACGIIDTPALWAEPTAGDPAAMPPVQAIPGGVENVLAFDAVADPRTARNVETGAIHCVSCGWSMTCVPSHSELERDTFMELAILGAEYEGRPVALICTALDDVHEVSTVPAGADRYATDLDATAGAEEEAELPAAPVVAAAGVDPGASPPETEAPAENLTAEAEPAPLEAPLEAEAEAAVAPLVVEVVPALSVPEASAAAILPEPLHLVAVALGLPETSVAAACVAAIDALRSGVATVTQERDAALARVQELQAAEDRRVVAAAIDQAILERKVAPARRADLEAQAAQHGQAWLEATLALIPPGASGVPAPGRQGGPIVGDMAAAPPVVTDGHRATARRLLAKDGNQHPTAEQIEARAIEFVRAAQLQHAQQR